MYMYIVIISFLLSVQNKIKYNLWISMNNFTNSNMKSRGMNFSPSNIIRKERKDAVAKIEIEVLMLASLRTDTKQRIKLICQ